MMIVNFLNLNPSNPLLLNPYQMSVAGPMLNGATNVVFEGVPTHPTPARCWEIVEKYKV